MMLRLTVLLGAAIFVTLLIAGEDKGQMRPGLARAVAAGEDIVIVERRRAAPADPGAEATVPMAAVSVAAAPAVENSAGTEAVAVAASYTPPARKVTPEPVFTLSALPTVTADQTVDTVQDDPATAPPVASGNVWYVTANTVNVRQGPSTDTSVVDKLRRGEAVTVRFEEGSEWAHVTIEGDGLEGYVALRFLAPDTP